MKVLSNLKYGQIHTKSGEHEQKMFDFIKHCLVRFIRGS